MTVNHSAEANIWPLRSDRPSESVRLVEPGVLPFNPHAAVSQDGRYVAANPREERSGVWERKAEGFKETASIHLELGEVFVMRFSPDGKRLAVVGHIHLAN